MFSSSLPPSPTMRLLRPSPKPWGHASSAPPLSIPHLQQGEEEDENARPLAESLLLAIADLLFCPDFTVQNHRRSDVVRHPGWALILLGLA